MRATVQPVSTHLFTVTIHHNLTLETLQLPHLHAHRLLPLKAHPFWGCRSGYFRMDPQQAPPLTICWHSIGLHDTRERRHGALRVYIDPDTPHTRTISVNYWFSHWDRWISKCFRVGVYLRKSSYSYWRTQALWWIYVAFWEPSGKRGP
jgi:hypothetical protein